MNFSTKYPGKQPEWDKLLNIMAELRSEHGCPWDKEQTRESLKPYLIEESYEVIDAIDSGCDEKICDELGDLLLQVVFHAQLAAEEQSFDISDVVNAISTKMIRRHPHVFADSEAHDTTDVLRMWEAIKATETPDEQHKRIMSVNANLPALMLAQKVQAKAARVGFDWNKIDGAWDKVDEELQELKVAIAQHNQADQEEELGDCLFSLINVARFLNIDAENALRGTIQKFITRFNYIEDQLQEQKKDWAEMSFIQLDALWDQAKQEPLKYGTKK